MSNKKQASILTINAGSSSLKFSVYSDGKMVLIGQFDRIKTEECNVKVKDSEGNVLTDTPIIGNGKISHSNCLAWLIKFLADQHIEITAIGHRVVHGKLKYAESVLLDKEVLEDLEEYCSLAPLHQPHNIAGIRACGSQLPNVPQVVCFDTAFHRDRPMVDRVYPIDMKFAADGILAYGFHGLSYAYIAGELEKMDHLHPSKRVAVCHLGNGASVCGMVNGKGVTSSMGFTALEGLMMGTRCGSIDPGVVLHLVEKLGLEQTTTTLYKESGFLGLSGVSSDVRDLEKAAESGNRDAMLAMEKFSKLVAKEIGYLIPDIADCGKEGLDTIVFTAGIGEKSARIRQLICSHLTWLGVLIDPEKNARNETCISFPSSRITVYVIPTNEEQVIARDTAKLACAA